MFWQKKKKKEYKTIRTVFGPNKGQIDFSMAGKLSFSPGSVKYF